MNCTTCNAPLEPQARFCRNCGQPVSFAAPSQTANQQKEAPTILPGQLHIASTPQPTSQAWSQQPLPQQPPIQPQNQLSPTQPTPYQPNIMNGGAPMQNKVDTPKPRRRRFGCLARSLLSLVLLIAILAGAWFAIVRPYIRDTALNKLNSVLDNIVNQLPPQAIQAPSGPFTVQEQVLNNLLVLESSPNDLVKNPQVHITPSNIRLEFQINGIPSAVTGVPQVQQNKLVMTNINVEGLAALFLTPDDIQSLANNHLAQAQQKLNHPILSVQLKDKEMILDLGRANSTVPTLP